MMKKNTLRMLAVSLMLVVLFSPVQNHAAAATNPLAGLVRTNDRADYPDLSDAQFANMRPVTTTGMGEGRLYRSSNPINPELGRSAYADRLAAAASIKTFINLADSEAEAVRYPGYSESYYQAQNHIFLGLPVSCLSKAFKEGLADGFRFMIANDPPYLIHCTEGKDRAGFVCAVLECLMGAGRDEVIADYLTTYHNYYSVENGSRRALTEEETANISQMILKNLKLSFGVEITPETDLVAAAEQYLQKIGLSAEEVMALKERLH